MPKIVENRGAVLTAAAAWAKAQGYPSITAIPPDRAGAVVDEVARQTGVPPTQVREALVRHWSAQNDRAARAMADLGAAPAYQGGAGHRPLSSAEGMRPIAALMAQKAAAQPARGVVPAPKDAADAASRLLSGRVRRELRAAFGPEAARFFEWPSHVARLAAGEPCGEDLVARFAADLGALATHPTTSAAVKNELFAARAELSELVDDVARRPSPQAFGLLFDALKGFVERAAQDGGVHVAAVAQGALGETTFRAMRPGERALAALKESDPAAYAVAMKRRAAFAEWERGVAKAIDAEGLVPSKAKIMGALVTIGTDPATGEQTVYSAQHGVMPRESFVAERLRFLDEKKALAEAPPALTTRLSKLDGIDLSRTKLHGEARWVSLTDDLAKDDPLTRVYAVKSYDGRDVVVEGKYAGIFLDQLVDATGRLVEGRGFSYDERTGRAREMPLTHATVDREPFVTATTVTVRGHARTALQLSMPNAQGAWTEVRQAIRALSNRIPSIRYEVGSKNTRFTFEPKDFAVIREALGGMALSSGALDVVRGYFSELAEAERATAKENLGVYTPAAIGGFKAQFVAGRGQVRDVAFSTQQTQALAWLEANGGKGVVALDTGMGKTLVAIAQMQKALRDAGPDQRFLWVCPPALRGNLAKEIHRWLEPAAAQALLARVDVVSFGAFRARDLDADRYHTVFFDEAQNLKNAANEGTKAALRFDHPRKICLSASPMEKSPMEAYVLGAVANNVDLGHPVHGKELRREMRKFRERFVETVGGRVTGVVKDPLAKQDLDTWMKRNVFSADKRDVSWVSPTGDEQTLPALLQRTESVTMSPEVEAAYRAATKELARAMKGMVALYRDKGLLDGKVNPLAKDPKIADVLGIGLRDVLKKLNELATVPGQHVPGAGSPKIERAADVIAERVAASDASRAVLFSDDPDVVLRTARELSAQPRFAGKIHAAAVADKVYLFKNGAPLETYAGHDVPFKAKPYRRDMAKPSNKTDNRHYQKAAWQQFVLQELLANDRDVLSCTLLGQTYQTGQNLQAYDTVVHLDRDTWNSEDMRQRTARAWRQGQEDAVLEVTIDAVYAEPRDALDATFDEIRGYHQQLEGAVFDAVVKGAQTTTLASEWYEIDARRASFVKLDRSTFELMTSPFVGRARPPGERDVDGAT